MRAIIRLLLVATVLFTSSLTSYAQTTPGRLPAIPSRFSIAGDILAAQPKGEFGDYVDKGFGGNVVLMYRLDEAGMLSLRADIGGMQYDHERRRVPFLPYSGRILLDVTTSNDVFWGSFGPQLVLMTSGPIRPYVNAAVGVQTFVTRTSLSGSDDDSEYASTTNSEDATFAYIFGGGVYIPLGKSRMAPLLNFGGRYHFGGSAQYLRRGDIVDNPDGTITLNHVSSKTDVIMWQLGISVPLPTFH